MGVIASRAASPAFRERTNTQWQITNDQWRDFVVRTFTRELVEGSPLKGQVDAPQLHHELTEVQCSGDNVVAGRAVYVGDRFVSFGQVLIDKAAWSTYEGVWLCSDFNICRGCDLEFTVERDVEGGLMCRTSGVERSGTGYRASFQGRAFRLHDSAGTTADGAADTWCERAPSCREVVVWRRSKDGDAEFNVAADPHTQHWQPCELALSSDSSRATITKGAKVIAQLRRVLPLDVATAPVEQRGWRFDGVDLVFDAALLDEEVGQSPSSGWTSGVCGSRWCQNLPDNVLSVALHFARLDEQAQVLQIIYSRESQVGSLSVPAPRSQVAKLRQHVASWEKFRQPLMYRGQRYDNEEDFVDTIHVWLMLDMMVMHSCYAMALLSYASAGDAAPVTATDEEVAGGGLDGDMGGPFGFFQSLTSGGVDFDFDLDC